MPIFIIFSILGYEFFQANILGDIIANWWWVPLPFLLYRPFLFLWLWWRGEIWFSQQEYVLIEIKIPKEIVRPIKAMEQAFHSIWGNIFDPPDWWEKWIEGKALLGFSLEIVSIEGEPHFFIRLPEARRNAVEASLYAQYPDLEISVVDDYTNAVPREVPNKNWSLWGTDYQLVKEDVYPIKTYSKFFEERPDVPVEEKRLDPLTTLLEGMAKLGPGEQLWIQIVATPIISTKNEDEGEPYFDRGKEIVDKLLKRPEKEKPKSIFQEAMEIMVTGKVPEKKKEEGIFLPEMRLSPGEREIVAGIEEKISKPCFKCHFRFLYIARTENYSGAAKAIPFGYFQQFATVNLNSPKPWPATITKIKKHWFLPLNLLLPRRLYLRKRNMFKNYINRLPPNFPHEKTQTFILNTEELATLFHFPGRRVAPAPFIPRVETRKGEAPPGLPIE